MAGTTHLILEFTDFCISICSVTLSGAVLFSVLQLSGTSNFSSMSDNLLPGCEDAVDFAEILLVSLGVCD